LPTVADSVFNWAALASTVTDSETWPTVRSTLTWIGIAASSRLRVRSNFLNPEVSTTIV
jgi:hypothetical protein